MKKQLALVLSIILGLSAFAPFSDAKAAENTKSEVYEEITFTDEQFIADMEAQGYDVEKMLAEYDKTHIQTPITFSNTSKFGGTIGTFAVEGPGPGGGTLKPGGTNKVVLRGEYTDVYLTSTVQKIIVVGGAASAGTVAAYFTKSLSGALTGTLISTVLSVVYGDKTFYPRIFRFKMYRNSYIYQYSFLQ